MDLSKHTLCAWLGLLGWEIETTSDGETFVAIARRGINGGVQAAAATTASESELPLAIFEAVCARVEAERELHELVSAAA